RVTSRGAIAELVVVGDRAEFLPARSALRRGRRSRLRQGPNAPCVARAAWSRLHPSDADIHLQRRGPASTAKFVRFEALHLQPDRRLPTVRCRRKIPCPGCPGGGRFYRSPVRGCLDRTLGSVQGFLVAATFGY